MSKNQLEAGTTVSVINKTGRYVAELVEWRQDKALVKILAVLRHPTQGDLHYPGQVDVVFHQRRALACNEKTWVHPASVKPYEEEIPDYKESLQKAIDTEMAKLREKGDQWSEKSIAMLEDLKHDYFKN
ncbi:MAG TPA: sporulation phosphorelay system protein KapB [Bacillales bacterium]|nr:sporulation phosphorelay system protein KapB [Bacillales bacterium]